MKDRIKMKRETPADPGVLATLTITETGETWFLREVDRLLVVGGKGEGKDPADELIVVDASSNSILIPNCYSTPDLGEAVYEAIDISTTRAHIDGK